MTNSSPTPYYFEKYFTANCVEDNYKKDFPLFSKNHDLIWLDNAATTQKPLSVIQTITHYYSEYNSNIHRGAHTLSQIATKAYEDARIKVKDYLHASSKDEIIFTSGATESINLVASTYGMAHIKEGDDIIISTMEHHSNIVPWQCLAQIKKANLKVIPLTQNGDLDIASYSELLSPNTKFVALTHVSNVLGTINPIKELIEMAHSVGAPVLVDGAQSSAHLPINVTDMNADFFVLSGHKMYGPTGIGALYGKKQLLDAMPPWKKGGGMIQDVTFEHTVYNKVPEKFEAGTPNIVGAIGLGTAIDYINKIGIEGIASHEKSLTEYGVTQLSKLPKIALIGSPNQRISILSFTVDGMSPNMVAQQLNRYNIATRSGHHCAQPALDYFSLKSCNRASLGIYNTKKDIDTLVNVLSQISY